MQSRPIAKTLNAILDKSRSIGRPRSTLISHENSTVPKVDGAERARTGNSMPWGPSSDTGELASFAASIQMCRRERGNAETGRHSPVSGLKDKVVIITGGGAEWGGSSCLWLAPARRS